MPTYAIQNIIGDVISGVTLGYDTNSQIPSGAIISPASYESIKTKYQLLLVIDTNDVREMTASEKTLVPIPTIDSFREYRKNQIDSKTEQILETGFEYPTASGNFFDINEPARSRWVGIQQAADKGVLTNITIRDKNRKPLALTDATDIGNFWGAALAFESGATAAGGALLDSLDSALTIADLEAIVDTRN